MAKTQLVMEQKEAEGGDVVVPHPREQEPLRIRVLQHPGQTFYKDEGGKANHLVTVVGLEAADGGKVAQVGKVFVTAKLCYENGRDVEDGPEIFKVLSLEPKSVTSTDQKITVKFRIEKVSRRKDGQRFKVRFDVSPALSAHEVHGAFTSPVCVLSKRKFPALHGTAGHKVQNMSHKKMPSSSKRSKNAGSTAGLRRSCAPGSKTDLSAGVMYAMRDTISKLENKVSELIDKVVYMEKEQTVLRESLKRSRQEFQENYNRGSNNMMSQPDVISVCKYELQNEPVDHDDLIEFEPKALRRSSSVCSDVPFDFGLPSSPMGGEVYY